MKIQDSLIKDLSNSPINKTMSSKIDSSKLSRKKEFSAVLTESIEEVNNRLKGAEDLAVAIASGQEIDLPTAMTEINKADISFKMFLQIRNKALSAYEEIMRLQF